MPASELAAGAIEGPEIETSGGKRYARGDRVVTLAPAGDGRFVTSERGTVTIAEGGRLAVRFEDGRTESSPAKTWRVTASTTRTPVTVHRMQGATVDRAHVFADGGGRELAYVAMNRARGTSHVYVTADDLDHSVEDLTVEWSADRRQRWIVDVDEPAIDHRARRPSLTLRTESTLRLARLRRARGGPGGRAGGGRATALARASTSPRACR